MREFIIFILILCCLYLWSDRNKWRDAYWKVVLPKKKEEEPKDSKASLALTYNEDIPSSY